MQELRQSTEIKVRIGSAVDATDGVTPETGLSLATADQTELLKHNGAATVDVSANTFAAVTGCDGWYDLTLTTGNTDTLGQLTAVIQDSSLMCPIFRDFMVVNQNYWDSKYSTDRLQVDVRELGDANLALTTQMKADVNTECDTALADYDSPTKAEADASFNLVIADTEDLQTQVGTAGVGLTNIGGMSTGMKAEVNVECDTALTDYDAPTKPEMDVSFNALNDLSSGDVTTACTSSLTTYDPPTKTEMDVSFNAVQTDLTNIEADTQDLQTQIGTAGVGLTNVGGMSTTMKGQINTECDTALTDYDPPTKTEMDTSFNAVIVDTEDIQTQIGTAGVGLHDLGGMSVAMMGEIQTEVNDALVAQNLDHLVKDPVDTSFANTVHLNSIIGNMTGVGGSATFSRSTDSAEAIRNRGDTAWTTGGAGSISEILNVQALIPNSIDLADTATVRIALGLTNMVDDLPSTAEITPGTITIDRKAIGATSWTTVVDASANSEVAGLVYYDEVFDAASGYAAGDSIKITFKSQKITVDANDFEITGTDGWTFQTHIREAMVGTANAALAATALTDATWTDAKAAFLDHSIATVDGNVDAILLDTGTDGVLLADTATSAQLVDDAWDELLTGGTHNIASSAGRRVREIGAYAIESGTAQDGTANNITLATAASAIDRTYNRNLLVVTDNTGAGQTRAIVDYNGTTKVATIDRAWETNPDNTSTYQITANDTPLVVDHGLAQDGSADTITLRDAASAINNTYNNSIVAIAGGTGRGQSRLITGYAGSTRVATVAANWITNPDVTSVYIVMPYGCSCVGNIDDGALAQINDQVVDVLKTDTIVEMVQGAMPASPTFEQAINYLYRKLRNKTETTTTEDAIYDDAGTTKLYKAAVSDDGDTFSKGEYGSGA